jgi:hypothetical protein
MNYLQSLLAACALTLGLTLSAFAGEMHTPIAPPPPPPATGYMDTTSTVAGEMSGPGVSADPIMEIALNLAQSVLALF